MNTRRPDLLQPSPRSVRGEEQPKRTVTRRILRRGWRRGFSLSTFFLLLVAIGVLLAISVGVVVQEQDLLEKDSRPYLVAAVSGLVFGGIVGFFFGLQYVPRVPSAFIGGVTGSVTGTLAGFSLLAPIPVSRFLIGISVLVGFASFLRWTARSHPPSENSPRFQANGTAAGETERQPHPLD